MRDVDIFQMALGLTPPWEVASCAFSPEKKRLDIRLTFPRGGVFVCPECGRTGLKAYDTLEKTWRHLNFFQHEAWLSAKVPRVKCEQCGVRLVTVPWARPGSGFTLLFEALVMSMVGAMPVKTLAARIGESDTRLWRIIHHYVDAARARESYADVPSFGVDETACKRGHNYVSVFVDMARRKVLCDGRQGRFDDRAFQGGFRGAWRRPRTNHRGLLRYVAGLHCRCGAPFPEGAHHL